MNEEEKLDFWQDIGGFIDEYPSDVSQEELLGEMLTFCISFLVNESCCPETALVRVANIHQLCAMAIRKYLTEKTEGHDERVQ